MEGEPGRTFGHRVHRSTFVSHHMASTLNVSQAAKLHPCLYDYDAFWPVHEHLKRHLVSTRDKYSYIDLDLVALNDAEAVARGESRPPPRKKRQTASKGRQRGPPRFLSPSPSPSAPIEFAIDVDQPSLQQPEPLPCGHSQPVVLHDLHHQAEGQVVHLSSPLKSVFQFPFAPNQQPQQSHERLTIGIGASQVYNNEFLITLRDGLTAKGRSLRSVGYVRSHK
jgi:hypothetical protein